MAETSVQSLKTYNTLIRSSLSTLRTHYTSAGRHEMDNLIQTAINIINETWQRPADINQFNILYNEYKAFLRSQKNINMLMERTARERNSRIVRIKDEISSVVRLSELVDDLVHEQGEYVDNVEVMMGINRENVRRSNREMQITVKRRMRRGFYKRVVGIVCLVLVVCLIIRMV